MDIIQGIIIGIVQGLTEFLPVSSSAHLVFIQNILGVESSLAFDTFLHLGSLLAVLWFFRADIIKMIVSWISSLSDIVHGRFKEGFHEDPYKRLAWYVILATIPVGLVGVFFEDSVDALFSGALRFCRCIIFRCTICSGILLICNRYHSLLVSKDD